MQPRDTHRLTFRSVTLEDAETLDALNRAPGVLRFLERNPASMEYLRDTLIPKRMRMAVDHPGYGLWLAHLRTSGAFVGTFGLKPDHPTEGDAELGYRLHPEYWGHGLATEASREIVRYAFDELNPGRLVAITMAVNTPSRKVMERIGLHHIRTFHEHFDAPLPGTEFGEVEYALTREEWLLRQS